MPNWQIINADVLEWAADYDGPPFHSILCDPPYELNFMSKGWDNTGVAFQPETWTALAAHLLPGAFIMSFGGSRTYHRLACALEDSGLVIHPCLGWLQGQGFPKATRIDTQVDKAAGQLGKREVVGQRKLNPRDKKAYKPKSESDKLKGLHQSMDITAPATLLARAWAGHRYGLQALKPCLELVALAQKAYDGKPVDSITRTGAGALNIDAARVSTSEGFNFDSVDWCDCGEE